MRIQFKTEEVYKAGGSPAEWPRFAKGEVIDETVIVEKLKLKDEPTEEWKTAFLNRWLQRGVAVEVSDDVPLGVAGEDDDAVDYSTLTRAQLDALAVQRGVDISDAKNKGDVIAALQLADEKAE